MTGTPTETGPLGTFLGGAEVSWPSPGTVRATGRLRQGFAGFDGHFPGKPILAGAFQLEMAAILATSAVPEGWTLSEVRHARFRRMMSPGDEVDITIATGIAGEDRIEVKVSIGSGGARACQATLSFGGPPGASRG